MRKLSHKDVLNVSGAGTSVLLGDLDNAGNSNDGKTFNLDGLSLNVSA